MKLMMSSQSKSLQCYCDTPSPSSFSAHEVFRQLENVKNNIYDEFLLETLRQVITMIIYIICE